MDSSTGDYQKGYVRNTDLDEVVSPDETPVSQCFGDALGPGDTTDVVELEPAAEVRLTTETRVPENGSGDLMDVDGPEFAAEVALMNEAQARELEMIYNQQCFPETMDYTDDPPISDGLPEVPDQASLVPRSVTLQSGGAHAGLDSLLDEIIGQSKQRNDHGLRNGARVGKGHHRDVPSQADSEGDRPTLTKPVKRSREISEAGPSNSSKRPRRRRRQ